jgi:hypothetical protein
LERLRVTAEVLLDSPFSESAVLELFGTKKGPLPDADGPSRDIRN